MKDEDGNTILTAQAGSVVDIRTTLAGAKMDLIRVSGDPEKRGPV